MSFEPVLKLSNISVDQAKVHIRAFSNDNKLVNPWPWQIPQADSSNFSTSAVLNIELENVFHPDEGPVYTTRPADVTRAPIIVLKKESEPGIQTVSIARSLSKINNATWHETPVNSSLFERTHLWHYSLHEFVYSNVHFPQQTNSFSILFASNETKTPNFMINFVTRRIYYIYSYVRESDTHVLRTPVIQGKPLLVLPTSEQRCSVISSTPIINPLFASLFDGFQVENLELNFLTTTRAVDSDLQYHICYDVELCSDRASALITEIRFPPLLKENSGILPAPQLKPGILFDSTVTNLGTRFISIPPNYISKHVIGTQLCTGIWLDVTHGQDTQESFRIIYNPFYHDYLSDVLPSGSSLASHLISSILVSLDVRNGSWYVPDHVLSSITDASELVKLADEIHTRVAIVVKETILSRLQNIVDLIYENDSIIFNVGESKHVLKSRLVRQAISIYTNITFTFESYFGYRYNGSDSQDGVGRSLLTESTITIHNFPVHFVLLFRDINSTN